MPVRSGGAIKNYLALLGLIHRHVDPSTYVEIGVGSGRSLARVGPKTQCVGIDPKPNLRAPIPDSTQIFELSSDDFFSKHDLRAVLQGCSVDLAFIDGMHLFEFALRDFINLERVCARGAAIAVHDCYPPSAEAAARVRTTSFWTGDVWKLVLCLNEYRPDLSVSVVDTPPSGLALVTKLDPDSRVLAERYEEICKRLIDLEYDERAAEEMKLQVIPADWSLVKSRHPTMDGPIEEAPPAPPSERRAGHDLKRLARLAIESQRPVRLGAERVSTEITLCGYPDDWIWTLEKLAHDLEVQSGRPQIHRFENLTFFPRFSALYDESGHLVQETSLPRATRPRTPGLRGGDSGPPETAPIPKGLPHLDRSVVYGGVLGEHWGHFLTEGIARLWALTPSNVLPPETALVFHRPNYLEVPFVERFFHHAGIRNRLLELDRVTTLAEVFVPEPSFILRRQASSCHATMPVRVAQSICGDEQPRSDQPVYLSRRLVPRTTGKRSVSEEKLETALRTRGVRIVTPETVSFESQVRLFNTHSTFIGRLGSAFHSGLFSTSSRPLRTAVIGHLFHRGSYANQFMIDSLKGTRAAYIFDPADPRVNEATLDAKATVARLSRLSII